MSHVSIQPVRSYFDLGVVRKAGTTPYVVPLRHAKSLEAQGLCIILAAQEPEAVPKAPAGGQSSASPAAPASPETTAKPSGGGESKAKRGR